FVALRNSSQATIVPPAPSGMLAASGGGAGVPAIAAERHASSDAATAAHSLSRRRVIGAVSCRGFALDPRHRTAGRAGRSGEPGSRGPRHVGDVVLERAPQADVVVLALGQVPFVLEHLTVELQGVAGRSD